QYFLGYSSYQFKPGFDPSLFVTIRRRLPARTIEAINEIIAVIRKNIEFDFSDGKD
ncbi:MAG: IS5/IS1182 family transposase, partial [Candidatus Marinimicrobia bacterium]|nr:IS5/IS1182 family transposase [Candidatus Neomarinimicrobiota bacterium]